MALAESNKMLVYFLEKNRVFRLAQGSMEDARLPGSYSVLSDILSEKNHWILEQCSFKLSTRDSHEFSILAFDLLKK